jgi:hypothetical protein
LNVRNRCFADFAASPLTTNDSRPFVVPDGPWQKVAVGARHRLFLEAYSRRQNEASKPLKDAFYAMLVCEINNLSWSDPAQWDFQPFNLLIEFQTPLGIFLSFQ